MVPLTKPSYRDKPIFKNLTIATACRLDGQWTDEAIARWVTQRSGKFTAEMNDHVTHVIFPMGPTQPLKDNPRIRQALKRGVKACHVVTLDWLEDSIHKNKRLSETPYLLITLLKAERASELEQQKKARAAELEKRFVNTNLYHLYHDSTYFKYEVTITRENPEHGCEGQRYVLYLFESNAKPHLYWFAAKLYKKKGDSQPNFHRPSEWPQGFWTEYGKFKDFFRKKTGVDWDERLIRTDVADKSLFQYTPPVLGRPVGYVPEGCQRRSTPPPVDDGGQAGSSAMEMKVTEDAAGERNGLSQTENHVQTAIAIKDSASMIDQTQQAQVHGDDESPVTSTDVIMSDSLKQGLAPETPANAAITVDFNRPLTAEAMGGAMQATRALGQAVADTPDPLSLPGNTVDGKFGRSAAIDISEPSYLERVAALEDNDVKIEDPRNGDEEDKNTTQTDADNRMHDGEPVPDATVDFVMA